LEGVLKKKEPLFVSYGGEERSRGKCRQVRRRNNS